MKNNTKNISIIALIAILTVMSVVFYLNVNTVSKKEEAKVNISDKEKEYVSDVEKINSNLEDDELKNEKNDINENYENNNSNLSYMTEEDAKNKLLTHNNTINYEYQGDEKTYKEVLYDKGYEGYVFLPTVESDLGYFVDKINGDLYYFNPNGYLEKIN